jgi:UDPglucose--hexose-1-phosphate uridylyltransferase
MPELRHNVLTREWVIIATERAKRPHEFARKDGGTRVRPPYVPSCPFCPGNEDMTPPATLVIPDIGAWRVRVAPNKFAALSYDGERRRTLQGIRRTVTGVGVHEVIIESPDHSKSTAVLEDSQVETLIDAYLDRFNFASRDPRVEQVTIFKNHGLAAGTSLEHPHSQIIGSPVITSQIRDRMINALRHFDEFGECIFCHVLEVELKEQARVVMETEHFVAFVQFAALTPFSMLIMPRRHMSCFSEIGDAEAADLARILRRSLAKLYYGLMDPDFNYAIRTAPKEASGVKYFHWYLSIIPRLTRVAGFELGSGMFINTSLPEENASFLREVAAG